MAHAKVLRIDEQVLIGGCNLDDLSLFRNDELDLLFADPAVAELTERSIFDELAAMSTPARGRAVRAAAPGTRRWIGSRDSCSGKAARAGSRSAGRLADGGDPREDNGGPP